MKNKTTRRNYKTPEQSLFVRTKWADNGCLEWTGAVNNHGYGLIMVKGTQMLAHRFAYECEYGSIPKSESYHGTVIMHTCDNPKCCYVYHLKAGTQADNVADMIKKGRKHGSTV